MTRSSSATAPSIRAACSGSSLMSAAPCSPMPTANRDWITPSWSSFAMRSRSSRIATRWASRWARAYSSAIAAWSANRWRRSTSSWVKGRPPRIRTAFSVPNARPRSARGTRIIGPMLPRRTTGW